MASDEKGPSTEGRVMTPMKKIDLSMILMLAASAGFFVMYFLGQRRVIHLILGCCFLLSATVDLTKKLRR